MTRQQSNRSKVDRSKNRSETPSTKCLVGGKLDETDWNEILDEEEGEQIVYEYIQEIINSTVNGAYKSYLNRQLIPFAVHEVSEAFLQMIGLEFIEPDPGDSITSASWLDDNVPSPCKIDSWAQGAMSKRCELAFLNTQKSDQIICAPAELTSKKGVTRGELSLDKKTEQKLQQDEIFQKTKDMRSKLKKKEAGSVKRTVSTKKTIQQSVRSMEPNTGTDDIDSRRKGADESPEDKPRERSTSRIRESLDTGNQAVDGAKRIQTLASKKATTQSKRLLGSERFAFDDEGNLIGVPRLVSTPTKANRANKQAVLHEQPTDRLGSITNTVGVKWRLMPITANEDQSVTGEGMDSNFGSDIQQKKTIVPTVPDIQLLKRKQQVKAMASGVFSVIDLMEPMPGVSITDGDRTRIGLGIDKELNNQIDMCRWNELKQIKHNEEMMTQLGNTSSARIAAEQMLKLDAIRIKTSQELVNL